MPRLSEAKLSGM